MELLAEKKAVSLEVENLSQIHFTPPKLTKFAFHVPDLWSENVTEEMITMVEAAIQVAGYQGDTVALAGGGDPTIQENLIVSQSQTSTSGSCLWKPPWSSSW